MVTIILFVRPFVLASNPVHIIEYTFCLIQSHVIIYPWYQAADKFSIVFLKSKSLFDKADMLVRKHSLICFVSGQLLGTCLSLLYL